MCFDGIVSNMMCMWGSWEAREGIQGVGSVPSVLAQKNDSDRKRVAADLKIRQGPVEREMDPRVGIGGSFTQENPEVMYRSGKLFLSRPRFLYLSVCTFRQ